jgi:DNA primase
VPFLDFNEIKRRVTIEQAAEQLGLQLKKERNQLRGSCPSCNSDDRALAITPDRGLFYCFSARTGGDCIALVSHITGVDVQEAAQFLDPHPREVHNSPSPTTKHNATVLPFDPVAFAAKLAYTAEVKALGFTEQQAKLFAIGWHRGRVYFPIRHEDGRISAFIGYDPDADPIIKLPPKFL